MPRWTKKSTEPRTRDEFLDAIGKKIKQHRLMADLTQKQLAEKLGASSSWVFFMEDGQMNAQIHSLRKVAELFEIPISSLLPDDSYRKADPSLEAEATSALDSLIDGLTSSLATAHKLKELRRKR